jgi:hypothetical protein
MCDEIQITCSEVPPFSKLLITFPRFSILQTTYFHGWNVVNN